MSAAFDRDALAGLCQRLPELQFDAGQDRRAGESAAIARYLRFYQIDFADQLPGAFHAMGRLVTTDYTLACHYWLPAGPAKATVLLVHGYFDHVGLFGHLIRYLLQHDYAVVAYDLPGHGLSSGARATIASFDEYVAVFNQLVDRIQNSPLPAPLSAIGQSTGGAIVLKRILEQGGDDFDRVTVLAPLVEPAKWWLNKLVYKLTHRFRTAVPRNFMSNSNDPAFVAFLATDPLQDHYIAIPWVGAMKAWVAQCRTGPPCDYPFTLLQGGRDTTVSWRLNLRLLRRRFPAAQVTVFPTARHHMVNEAEPLRQRIFAAMGFD